MDNTPTTRLPRFRRAATEVNIVLTKRDLEEILANVHSYRLLTSDQIQALAAGSKQNLLRRLQKLFHAGYLDRLAPRFAQNGGSETMIYAITNRGVNALQKEGVLKEVSTTDRNAANRDLHDFSIRHRLLVSHIRAVITLACGNHPNLKLLDWKEGRQIQGTTEVALPRGWERVPVAADGFFALGTQEARANFFVEADRGTMTLKRFTNKLQGFAAWYRENRHEEKLGIKSFRVLTVTSSHKRLRHLVASARQVAGVKERGRMFLFTAEEKLLLARPETMFNKIWTSVAEDEPCSIL